MHDIGQSLAKKSNENVSQIFKFADPSMFCRAASDEEEADKLREDNWQMFIILTFRLRSYLL